MSRKISRKSRKFFLNYAEQPQHVVIKGFMEKPTALKFIKNSGKCVTMLCRDEKTQMNFANDIVYQYDAENYKQLCEAYENEDKERLEQEWKKAKPIALT